jgi:uncharacterized protein (DUF2141 family)
MLKKIVAFIFIVVMAVTSITGCARRGSISGGLKDTIPPVVVGSSPKNMTTDFNGKQIRIDFNEYIKVKDINKQLIISPPMDYAPDIYPMGSASRYIDIKIKDTLKPNTTYSFNFGQSITDNNEGNPYSQFKFIFSTGSYIDSLAVGGMIKDAYSRKADNFVTVMLYEADETYTDSTIYKEKPRYVTNTLDSLTNFTLENLKEGKYYIFALKDKGNNYVYNPKSDKIAFLKEPINVPNDSLILYQLSLFKEQLPLKPLKPSQISSNRLVMGYEGDPRTLKAKVKNGTGTQDIPSVLTNLSGKDSVQVWLPRNIEQDSVQVSVNYRDTIKDFVVKIKEMKTADSLSITAVQKGGLHFRERFTLNTSTPIVTIDTTKISLINKDSVAVKINSVIYNTFEQKLEIDFPKEESQKYNFTFLPGALTDFYEKSNDTLTFNLSTRTYSDYGNLRVTLQNAKRFPLILEVLNASEEVKASYYSKGETNIVFDAVLPDQYVLRVIYDDNGNGEWDSGNFLEKRQPEEVIYFPNEVQVRANWDVDQPFNLGGG